MATTPTEDNPDSSPTETPDPHPDQLGDDQPQGDTATASGGNDQLAADQAIAGQRASADPSPMADAGTPGGTAGTGGTAHDWDQ